MDSFTDLPLIPALQQALANAGYTRPTAIQAASLGPILEGRDLLAQAPTGSGKTAAFGLGLLQRIDPAETVTQALVLCPTRELADQVAKALRQLASGIPNIKLSVLTGGMPLPPQIASLAHAPHVVVGTPGRVQDLLRKQVLDVTGVTVFVLDEADRMLDMGFEDEIRDITRRLSRPRQTLLFSATWPDAIREMARSTLESPHEVSVEGQAQAPRIEQWFHEVALERKQTALAGLLLKHQPESTVVFCNTKRDVDDLTTSLNHLGFDAAALHGDLEQRDRDEVLVRFANRSLRVLVASDVAARGLDVKDLACVVNYELPTDVDTYQHRIGRTARAGETGLALALVTPRERPRAQLLEEAMGSRLRWAPAPPVEGRPQGVPKAAMATLRLDAGRTDKLRPGDVLGALTGSAGLPVDAIGKIDIYPTRSYVAVARGSADRALSALQAGKIKGRKIRVRRI